MHCRAFGPHWKTVYAAAAVAACLCAPRTHAQTALDGAIAGTVIAVDGQPIATVHVLLRALRSDPQTLDATLSAPRIERDLVTDARGRFLALRLEPGDYVLEALAGGSVIAQQRLSVELGEVEQAILQVSKKAASPAAPGGASDDSFSESSLRTLPLEDRRWEDVALLSSDAHPTDDRAVSSDTSDDGEQQRKTVNPDGATLLSFRGLAPTQNSSLLDGVSSDQAFRGGTRGTASGGARSGSSFSQSAVGRFRVAPHGYSAQYGGAAGGMLAAGTLRGGDSFHGGAFYLLRTSALAAANPFSLSTHYRDGVVSTAVVKPDEQNHQIGGRAGGPIARKLLHNALSGFISSEAQWHDFPAYASPATASFFTLTPNQTALLGNRGVTATARNAALNYLDSLTGIVPRSSRRSLTFARLDLRAGPRDVFAGSYTRSRSSSPAGSGSGPSAAVVSRGSASLGDSTVRVDAGTVRWLHLFNAKLTNEVRAQLSRDLEFEQPRTPLAQEPAISPGGYAPQVTIHNGSDRDDAFTYGTPATLGRHAYPDERRVQLADVLQWAPRGHIFTIGADWSRINERIDALNNTDGSFNYDSGVTGGRAGGLVDWITDYTFNARTIPNGGCPSINAANHFFCFRSFTQSFGQERSAFVLHEFAGFAQDHWRLRPGLTVELGARYEYLLLPLPQRPNVALDAAFRASGATNTFPEDRNNLGPRVALAWAPRGGRWGTVRAGYGAHFGRLPGATVRAALVDTALPTTATHIRITPETVTACPQVANQGFGYPCAYVSAPPAAIAATTSATIFATNFRLPAIQQAELTLERAWHGVSARATYSAAWGTQLPNTADTNIAPATGTARFTLQGGDGRAGVRSGETFILPLYTTRLSTQFGPVSRLESNANATWHGLTVEARGRLSSLLTFRGSYTWSKAIDFGAEQGTVPRVNGQFDPFNIRGDKGLADADIPHRFAGDLSLQSRLTRGPRLLQIAATGWRLAALTTASSGRPYSYEVFGGTRLSGGSYSLNGSGGSVYLPTVGRNTLRLPLRWNVDARLGRSFHVTHRLRAEAHAEAFNLANHASAARVNTRAFLAGVPTSGVTPLLFQDAATVSAEGLSTSAFGAVTSSTAGPAAERQVQLGVRVDF